MEEKETYIGSYTLDGRIYVAYESNDQIKARWGERSPYYYSISKRVIKDLWQDIASPLKIAILLAKGIK